MDKLSFEILKDLTQKAYNDCEQTIFRTASLIDRKDAQFSLVISIGVNLINNTLSTLDKEKMGEYAYNTIVNNIKSSIDNLPQDFQP